MINLFETRKYTFIVSILLIILCSIILIWGYFAPLSTLAVASGKIIVDGKNKEVQHLEGGIVKEIIAKNGKHVKQNDLLLKLDDTSFKADYQISLHEYIENSFKLDRLMAQKNQTTTINFHNINYRVDKEFLKEQKQLQRNIFNATQKLIKTNINIIQEKINAQKEQISGIEQSIISKNEYIQSLDEELQELQELYDKNLIDKVQLREIKRKKILYMSELNELKIDKSSLLVNITQNKEEILKIKNEFISQTLEDIKTTQLLKNETKEKITILEDKLQRTNITAPIDGTIDNLTIFTIGSVINRGETLMSIVPDSANLIIDANLKITDVDNVKIGQHTNIVFSAFKTKMTFSIDGVVSYVSADRQINEKTNEPFYQVQIKVSPSGYKQIKQNNFVLKAGMPADVMIHTGSRSMLSYLIKPFVDMKLRAFNEE
jgi:epimerase transport system membrane fusion protein